jgi:hypothetical protein
MRMIGHAVSVPTIIELHQSWQAKANKLATELTEAGHKWTVNPDLNAYPQVTKEEGNKSHE